MSIWDKIIRWWYSQDEIDELTGLTAELETHLSHLTATLNNASRKNTQLEFLITQLPIMNAPDTIPFASVNARYVYIHPETFSRLMNTPLDTIGGLKTSVWSHGKNATQWVATPLIPRNGIVYSPNQMPGIETLISRTEEAYANR
jgi:hypothetical protein